MPHQQQQYSDSGYSSRKDFNMAKQGSNGSQTFYAHNGDSYNPRLSARFPMDYRDTGSSVSGFDSVAEAFGHPMDFSPDDAIDPRLNGPSDPAGFAGDNYLPFVGQFEDQVSMEHITQRSPVQGPRGAESTLNLPSQDATGSTPWSSLQVNQTMQRSSYLTSPNNPRKRLRPDNSNGPSPISHYSSSPTGSTRPLPGSTAQQDPFYSMTHLYHGQSHPQYLTSPVQLVQHNQQSTTTSAPQRRSTQQGRALTRGNKQPRNKNRKFSCQLCNAVDKVFATTNDLDRHVRTVHAVILPGSRVWKCNIPGCLVANKLWARQDNFKQHVVRMHGAGHGDAAENMWVEYNPEVHGRVEASKGKRAPGSRHSNGQELPSPSASGSTSNNINMKLFKSQSFGASNNAQLPAYIQHQRPSITNSDRASITNNPASKSSAARNASYSVSISSVDPGSQLQHGISPFLHPSIGIFSQNTLRQRTTVDRHTLANPETHIRQQREMQEQDSTSPHLTSIVAAGAEFGFLGQVMEDNSHAVTVSPGDLSIHETGPTNAAHTIHLASPKTSAIGDPLRAFIDGLPEELREKFFEACNPEILKELSSTCPPKRSISKTKSKGKQTDATKAPKTLKCNQTTKVNGKDQPCQKTFDKHNELRKHEKRHAKIFGCSFDHCYKRFGTKWEWKRHEHNQHVQLESWRCRQKSHNSTQYCAQLFQEKEDFRTHIRSQHSIFDERSIELEFQECHLSKKWLGSFWCGFCAKIIKSAAQYGPEMDKERNDHVSKHVEGRIGQARDMWDWEELAGKGKTKEMMRKADKRASLKHNDTKMPTSGESEDEDEEDNESEQGAETEPEENSPRPHSTMDTMSGRAGRESITAHNSHDRSRSSATAPAFQANITAPDTQEGFTVPEQYEQYYPPQLEQQQRSNDINFPDELDYDVFLPDYQ